MTPAARITCISFALITGLVSCAGKKIQDDVIPFERDPKQASVEAAWAKKTPGIITDLNLARDAGSFLVTTRPDFDVEGAPRDYLVSLYSGEGGKLWSNAVPYQVKSQDIARDASLSVIVTYNNELTAWDAAGKKVWMAASVCRPHVLASQRKVVCFHDDDAQPETAFDVFDWNGTKLSSFPIKNDALSMKISADEKNLTLGLTRGQIMRFTVGAEKPVWQKKVSGEIADLAVTDGMTPRVAVLHGTPRIGQKIAWLDENGKILAEVKPSVHLTQVEVAADGHSLYGYGNSPKGQYLVLFEASDTGLVEKWRRGDARFADYATPMSVTGELALIGFEDFSTGTRRSRLLAFTPEGKVRWSVPLKTDEGAYLYAQTFSPARSLLGVGTDDSMLVGYRIDSAAGR